MKAYKGFNKDMTCSPNGVPFQYEEGKEYETDKAECCNSGFHACEMPLDTFKYYQPSKSVYHEVDQSGKTSKDGDKTSSTKIRIGARLSIKAMVKAQVELVFKKASKENNVTSGEESSAATDNKNAVALACGKNAKAKGTTGAYLVLTEWNDEQTELICARMERVDGDKIKPDTWYKLENGEFVEVEDET